MNKPHTSGPSTNPFDDSAHPLTDDQTKSGVTANLGYIPSDHSRGQILLYGECRDLNDHHHDPGAGVDITNQLNAR